MKAVSTIAITIEDKEKERVKIARDVMLEISGIVEREPRLEPYVLKIWDATSILNDILDGEYFYIRD